MRSHSEIQRAHDMLHGVVLGSVTVPMAADDVTAIRAALDCLCWVLQHDHNPRFEENLRNLEGLIGELGFTLRDSQGGR